MPSSRGSQSLLTQNICWHLSRRQWLSGQNSASLAEIKDLPRPLVKRHTFWVRLASRPRCASVGGSRRCAANAASRVMAPARLEVVAEAGGFSWYRYHRRGGGEVASQVSYWQRRWPVSGGGGGGRGFGTGTGKGSGGRSGYSTGSSGEVVAESGEAGRRGFQYR
jgi:hypothetical protein